jgi:hypothetical protein
MAAFRRLQSSNFGLYVCTNHSSSDTLIHVRNKIDYVNVSTEWSRISPLHSPCIQLDVGNSGQFPHHYMGTNTHFIMCFILSTGNIFHLMGWSMVTYYCPCSGMDSHS